MEKEYFFILRLKNGGIITVWDYITEHEARIKCQALHKHYNGLTSSICCPSEYRYTAAFLNVMKSLGFNGYWELSPI